MVVLIDNYDSFTYNLYQLIGEFASQVKVIRNDKVSLEELEQMKPTHIIISPGPGYPKNAGISTDLVKKFYKTTPILGVCLGHQVICEAFGGKIIHAQEMFHGKSSLITLKSVGIFEELPEKITVGRYHSLIAETLSLPVDLEITAFTDNGEIMAVKHREYPVYGIQFHPESILTEFGGTIIRSFIRGNEYV